MIETGIDERSDFYSNKWDLYLYRPYIQAIITICLRKVQSVSGINFLRRKRNVQFPETKIFACERSLPTKVDVSIFLLHHVSNETFPLSTIISSV